MTSEREFETYLDAPEGTNIEFKTARNHYSFDELVKYCVAIANEGGGKIIFGVTDRRPRSVVGTSAFDEPGRTEAGIYDRINRRVSIEENTFSGERVLIVHVPPRQPGSAWSERGTYWMRAGEALVPMTDEKLQAIHSEVVSDFSAGECPQASIGDLDSAAIETFRKRWAQRERREYIQTWDDSETLRNAELMSGNILTFAALVLFGTRSAMTEHLAQAEIVFEYRSSEAAGPAQDREEFREGFMLIHDKLWNRINQRNDRQNYQDGLFRTEVLTFDEAVIREAILNAFCHRDYRLGNSVFVRQYARRLEVTSPGGFPLGVSTTNMLDAQNPRNRRLAEALGRCGLVERAGQGMNLMFETAIRQAKPLPDFTGTSTHEVRLTLQGNVTNPAFLQYFEKVGSETLASFNTSDLLVLDCLQREEKIPSSLRVRLPRLLEIGIVESIGRGRGTQYLLSRRFYKAIGRSGSYTRRRGLDRGQNKELLLKHLKGNKAFGTPISELQQVLPALSRAQLKRLLDELRQEGRIKLEGQKRGARWFVVD